MAAVHASYYTDPACPWSWSIEPALRRLEVEFAGEVAFTYVLASIGELPPAAEFAGEWLDASAASGMPVDPQMWLNGGGARSSQPACLAVKAGAEQGDSGRYLRRLREGLAYEGRRLDHLDAFVTVARETPGLDAQRFGIDAASHAIVELLGSDIERGRAVAPEHHAEGAGRVALPSLEFRGEDGTVHGVYGPEPYAAYRAAALAAGAQAGEGEAPSVEAALGRWDRLATPEIAAACDLPGPRAAAELWRLAGEWRVRAERRLTGEVWSRA
ncbi:MAG: DsbA family oxidoreductase [Solirubrobacteraceae bacterium]